MRDAFPDLDTPAFRARVETEARIDMAREASVILPNRREQAVSTYRCTNFLVQQRAAYATVWSRKIERSFPPRGEREFHNPITEGAIQ